jgi:virginiamycin B lyase
VVRQAHLVAVVGTFLVAIVVVGCGTGTGKIDERDGERGPAANKAQTTASVGKRTAAGSPREPVGLDFEVVSPVGRANLPAGFGEGTLWATDFEPIPAACDDMVKPGEGPCSASTSASTSASPYGGTRQTLLRRLDPRTGEEVAAIPLEGLSDVFTQVAFGAGSVWVSSGYYSMGPPDKRGPGDVVLRIDPQTNRVVDRIPVDPPSGLAFGHGSVWATSAAHGTLTRIDPEMGEVAAKIEVGRGAVDVAADEGSGAVWVASVYLPKDYGGYDSLGYSEDRNLTRVDPATNRVVAEIPVRAGSRYGGGADHVAVGEGAVWAQGGGELFKVDPATDEVTATVSVGGSSSHLAVYGGAVWAMAQVDEFRLARVDPRTVRVVASEDIGPIPKVGTGGMAAGGGYVWFSSRDGLTRVAP